MKRFNHIALLAILLLVGCGEAEEPVPFDENQTTNQNTAEEDENQDVVDIGDIDDEESADLRCDGAVIDEWPLLDMTSTGDITSSEDAGIFTATIDATAGGMSGAADNPFIYLNLQTGQKVDITDLESLESADWDLAFKRVAIRTNSADSGPADARLAKRSGTSLASETTAPANTDPHHQDVTFEDDCTLRTDPIGTPVTAFNLLNPMSPSGSWYDYSEGVSTIDGDVYFLTREDRGETYVIEIQAWTGGEFDIAWKTLEN